MFPPKDVRKTAESGYPKDALHLYVTDIGMFAADFTNDYFADQHANILINFAYQFQSYPRPSAYVGPRRAVAPEPHFFVASYFVPQFLLTLKERGIDANVHIPNRDVTTPAHQN